MKVALFLTADRDASSALVARELQRHPANATPLLVAFIADGDRAAFAREFPAVAFRSDKPAGGKLAFLRALRAERFDRAVVAWHGGERFRPLRLAALFAGAREVTAVDERGVERRVAWHAPWTWAAHAARRAAGVRVATIGHAFASLYRATIGLCIGCALLAVRALARRVAGR